MTRFEKFAPQRGFTLVELVTIIVVLGILAVVAIPNFSGVSDDAKRAKAQAIFGSLKASYATQKAIKKGGTVLVDEIVFNHDPGCSVVSGATRLCGNAYVGFVSDTNVPPPAGWSCNVDVSAGPSCS